MEHRMEEREGSMVWDGSFQGYEARATLPARPGEQAGWPFASLPPVEREVPYVPPYGRMQDSFYPGENDLQYLNGFLRSQLGQRVTVEFASPAGQVLQKTGRLLQVGYNYIALSEEQGDGYTLFDFFGIRFITVHPRERMG